MKPRQQHIDQIRKKFAEMQNKEDLVSLLCEAKNMLYGKECEPFRLKSITYYANPKLSQKSYKRFSIKKKSGGERIINAPVKGLKSIQRSLNFIIQCIYSPDQAATGFVINKSIVDNARLHTRSRYVYNIDLKDFFHSFDRNKVKLGFMYEPFRLNNGREPLAFLLACLCTHPFEIDGNITSILPQGSPTSPTITNILCKKLDRRLTGLANRFGAKYSRYADDITFSSSLDIFNDKKFLDELHRIIVEDQQLVINFEKTRLQNYNYQQEVTGLTVNKIINVRQRYIKQLRMWLFYWKKYGYLKAQDIFLKDYIADKGHVKKGKPQLINVIDGKLEFLKMVKGVEDGTYLKLKKRFDKLTKSLIKTEETEVIEDQVNITGPSIKYSEEKPFENYGKLLLTIRALDQDSKILLLNDKLLPKGLSIPYDEKFVNKAAIISGFQKVPSTAKPLPHNPASSTKFILQFKTDESGLKELVHVPAERLHPEKILEMVKNHPNLSSNYEQGEKPGFKSIHKDILSETIKLVDLFEKIGAPYWEKFGCHPFGEKGLAEYTAYVLDFKKKYRFGPSSEGYTNLSDMIMRVIKHNISRFNPIVHFKPDDRKFGLRANFYTWTPSIESGINYIVENINSHSNITGEKNFSSKELIFELSRNRENATISLSITDKGSFCLRPPDEVYNDFQRSEASSRYFRSLCDWAVLLNDGENSYQLNILKRIEEFDKENINIIDHTPNGFTHILTFYEA